MRFLHNVGQLMQAAYKAVLWKLQSWFQPRESLLRRSEAERLDRIRNPSKYLGK